MLPDHTSDFATHFNDVRFQSTKSGVIFACITFTLASRNFISWKSRLLHGTRRTFVFLSHVSFCSPRLDFIYVLQDQISKLPNEKQSQKVSEMVHSSA